MVSSYRIRRRNLRPLKILSLSSEVAPFAKTGGLADVCGSLPKALAALGHDVRIVMPAYGSIEQAAREGKYNIRSHPTTLRVPMGPERIPAGVLHTHLPGSEVPAFFIADWHRFGDRMGIYGYWDDPFRFAFYSRAALDLMIAALDWRPDVIHAHDWHAAPAITWLDTAGRCDERYSGIPTVFTIHNLMHQGNAPWRVFDYLGLVTHGLFDECYGEVNFMARGIFHATMINTVSPTYSREIMTKEGGCGLDGLLRYRHFDVHGILNGLDYDVWDPNKDENLTQTYDRDSLDKRVINKRALQERVGLPQRDDVPLLAMITRLDFQKGLDIAGHVFHLLLNNEAGDVQIVVLGSGDPHYEGSLRHLAGYHNQKMAAILKYDPHLAPLIYGGSDLFLMPSLFEPCGLGQLIAMRYGSVPIVRATGGLADTVRDSVTGFTFTDYKWEDFWHKTREALHIYQVDPESWRAIQQNGMKNDYSWEVSARSYQQLYEWAIARVRGH